MNTILLFSKDMEKLTKFKASIQEKVEGVEREGYKPKPDVLKWPKDVQKPENEWESMQESIATVKNLAYKCCLNHLRGSLHSSTNYARSTLQAYRYWRSFESNLVVENYQMNKVEFIPGPSIEGQSATTRNHNKILQLLEDDKGSFA